jgi:hypothetical protein
MNKKTNKRKIKCEWQDEASATSQKGKVYKHLQHLEARGEEAFFQPIKQYYLVDALATYGTRSREDLQKIANECISSLLKQIFHIQQIAGLNPEMSLMPMAELNPKQGKLKKMFPVEDDYSCDPYTELTEEEIEQFFQSFM